MNQTTKNNQTTENIKDVFVTIYLNDILKALQRFWWICVAAAVIFGSYSALSQKFDYVPEYQSNVTLTVNTQNASGSISGVSVIWPPAESFSRTSTSRPALAPYIAAV